MFKCEMLPSASASKRVLAQNFSCEDEVDLHENDLVDRTRFYNLM